MTTASAAGQPGRRHAVMMWLGHYGSELYLAGMTAVGVALATTQGLPTAVQWAVAAFVLPIMLLAVTAVALQFVVHDQNLCLRDLTQAPLGDPEGEVQRRMWWLRRYHRQRVIVSVLATFILILVMAVALGLGSAGAIVQTTALLAFIAFGCFKMQSTRIHRRLQPWCPMCRWGGGDDGPEEPSPVVPPANVRTRAG